MGSRSKVPRGTRCATPGRQFGHKRRARGPYMTAKAIAELPKFTTEQRRKQKCAARKRRHQRQETPFVTRARRRGERQMVRAFGHVFLALCLAAGRAAA